MVTLKKLSLKSVVLFLVVPMLYSCTNIKVGTHYDEKYYFEGYKTFSWISKDPIDNSGDSGTKISPLILKKIVESIQAELESKGYQYIDDIASADFGLSYTVGSRQEQSIDSYPEIYRHDWQWYWHGPIHVVDRWHVRSWTEGTLTIDIFDNKKKEPIWHGWATKTITKSDRKDPTESIQTAVNKIFAEFPVLK